MAVLIKSTVNYQQFKTKKGNRPVVRASVTRLANSIKKNNLLPVNPIIVNKEMYVIDGQHRLAAARMLNLPIYYVVFDPASLVEIQLLNANVKAWSAKDFMNSFIALGRSDYEVFKRFWERYKFPFSATLWILAGHSNETSRLFKEGNFKIINMQDSVVLADTIERLLKFTSSTQGARFYDAIIKIYYNDPTLVDRLEKSLIISNVKIPRLDTTRLYFQTFENIINHKNYGRGIRLY